MTLRRQRPTVTAYSIHVDVINMKHVPCYWPFVWGIRRSSADSPHKSQWRGALAFYLICAWINGVNNRKTYDLRRHRAHCNVTVMNIVAVLTTTGQRIWKQYFDLFVLGYSDFDAIRLMLPLVPFSSKGFTFGCGVSCIANLNRLYEVLMNKIMCICNGCKWNGLMTRTIGF